MDRACVRRRSGTRVDLAYVAEVVASSVLGNDASAAPASSSRSASAVRSISSSTRRTVRRSAAALADGYGPGMAVKSITTRLTMTRLQSDLTVCQFCNLIP